MSTFLSPAFSQHELVQAATQLAQTCQYDSVHARQVTRLSLRLFDELQPLHTLEPRDRLWLECAAILHDIGWIEGWRAHHKTSLNIILNTTLLPLENRDRLLVGSIARYHTKALPDLAHDHFAALAPEDRRTVVLLAALLRLADGLDRSHRSRVWDLRCKIDDSKIRLRYGAPFRAKDEEAGGKEKSDLLEQVYHRTLSIRWEPV